jgi:beta-carotene 15,15'-dioxygenase
VSVSAGLRRQGSVFCALAFTAAFVSLLGVALEALPKLFAAAVLLALLGMPHGALDVVLARKLYGLKNFKAWAVFSMLYVGLAAVVVVLWWWTPTLFLSAFLVGSALHFGGDLASRSITSQGLDARLSAGVRCLYGGAVIVLPALAHGPELQRLTGLVTGPESAALVISVLKQLAWPWLAASLLACAWQTRQTRQTRQARLAALEMLALTMLCVTATPLVAFTVYFCAMHSPRHILRTLAAMPSVEVRGALRLALWPTLAVLAALAAGFALSSGRPVQPSVMQLVFVGLAALTLPHMLLLERSRRAELTALR